MMKTRTRNEVRLERLKTLLARLQWCKTLPTPADVANGKAKFVPGGQYLELGAFYSTMPVNQPIVEKIDDMYGTHCGTYACLGG